MKNPNIKIELDNVSDEVSVWKKTVDIFCNDKPTIKTTSSNGFRILKDAGFSDKSFNTFDSNIENASFLIQEFYNTVSRYLTNMKESDTTIEEKIPESLNIDKQDTSLGTIDNDYESQFTKMNMGDLARERNALNEGKLSNGAVYNGAYNGVNSKNLENIVKEDSQQVIYKDGTINEKKVALSKLGSNTSGYAMYDSNSSIVRGSLGNINKNSIPETEQYDASYSIKEKQGLKKQDSSNAQASSFNDNYSRVL